MAKHLYIWLFQIRKKVAIVGLLINNNADVNAKDEDDWTPIHLACFNEYFDSANYSSKIKLLST
jgi:ankyrin repeat protein